MTTANGTTTTTQMYRVFIKARPQAVWDAITDPEWTRKYGYGGAADYDLRPGGAYRGLASEEMRAQGAPEVAVEGEVLEIDPPWLLVQTWRMVMDEAMAAEGFTRLTYELEEVDGVTKLTVTHELEGAPRLASLLRGEIPGAGGGWTFVLSDLKSLLETGEALGVWV